jgi:signal peptide peptidase SppA
MSVMESLFPHRAAKALAIELARDVWAEGAEEVEALFAEIATLIPLAGSDLMKAAMSRATLRQQQAAPTLTVRAGVAEIPIKGQIIKQPNWLLDALGIEYTSTDQTRALVAGAVADPNVHSIHLNVDSPGGTVGGTHELADEVHAASQAKPVEARISGMAASAAYWIASQASRITASPSASIGSIGVYSALADTSKAAEAAGVKVHAVRSSELKGIGQIAGAEVTPAQVAEVQGRVDRSAQMFATAVARGRGFDDQRTKTVSTGQQWFADEARFLGLIDAVETSAVTPAISQAGGSPASTQLASSEEEAMEVKDIAAQLAAVQSELQTLRDDKAKSEVQAAAAAKALEDNAKLLAEVKTQQKEAVLADGLKAGRIAPAQVDHMRKFAASVDVADLRAFVEDMEVKTHATAAGASPTRADDALVDTEQAAINAAFGIDAETHKQFGGFNAVGSDRKLMAVGPLKEVRQ